MEGDARREFGKLGVENFPGVGDDGVAALSAGYPPENENMIEIVEVRVMHDSIPKVCADGLINLPRALVTVRHEHLHMLQLFRQRHFRVYLNAGGSHQSTHG